MQSPCPSRTTPIVCARALPATPCKLPGPYEGIHGRRLARQYAGGLDGHRSHSKRAMWKGQTQSEYHNVTNALAVTTTAVARSHAMYSRQERAHTAGKRSLETLPKQTMQFALSVAPDTLAAGADLLCQSMLPGSHPRRHTHHRSAARRAATTAAAIGRPIAQMPRCRPPDTTAPAIRR